ncbi:MAG: Vms1/Ankzf1 family peptidyl-tRNA hydrolase [Halobacteriaceae archaeon]
MLDELLGRAELKNRISELETERDRLQEQLEAEQRRRSDAVSDKQAAEERVNRLEDRIVELEDRVERAQSSDEGSGPELRHRAQLQGGRVATVIDRLAGFEAPPDGALTAYIDGAVPQPVRETLDAHSALVDRVAPCLVCVDDAGLLAAGLDLVDPPAPFCEWGRSFRLEREWLEPRGSYALALVRSDLFAVGSYEDGDRTAVQGFQTDVKSDHSKGGFSQGRFERIREGQIRNHLDRAASVLDDIAADRLFVVGTGELLGEFADRATATATVDATGTPEAALADAHRSLWTVTCYGF